MVREHRYFVYMLASRRYGTLYTGVTSDLVSRTYQHKHDLIPGFTSRYGVHELVWFEEYGNINDAIIREKQIKGWNRAWKIRLIEKGNPNWDDLYSRILVDDPLVMPGEAREARRGKGTHSVESAPKSQRSGFPSPRMAYAMLGRE